MGFIPACMAALIHVLAGTYHRLSGSADVAIHQRGQLGTPGPAHMGSRCRKLVADVPVLASACPGHKAALCLGHGTAGSRAVGQIHGALRRGEDPLLPEYTILHRPRSNLLRRLGSSLHASEALVRPRRSRNYDARTVRLYPEPERLRH